METDRYLFIHIDDLMVDQEEIANMLLRACKRSIPYRVQAICQYDEEVLLTLTNCAQKEVPDDIRWLDISEVPFGELSALLLERWKASYEPIGCVTSTVNYDPQKRFLLVQSVLHANK